MDNEMEWKLAELPSWRAWHQQQEIRKCSTPVTDPWPTPFNCSISELNGKRVHPQQACRWYRTGRRDWHTRGLCCQSRVTSVGWRNRLTGTSCSLAKGSARSCTWKGTTHWTSTWQGPPRWKGAWPKITWRSWWTLELNMSEQCALTARVVQKHPCLRKVVTNRSTKGIRCSEIHLEFYIQFWTLQYERIIGILEWVQWKAMKAVKEVEHLS